MSNLNESITDLFALGILMKKLLTPVEKTQAFKLGLIDKKYKNLKKPETKEEKAAMSLMNKFIFKLKRILGPKVTLLSSFLLLMDQEMDGKLINEMNEIFKFSGHYILWNSELSKGVIGTNENVSRYYHTDVRVTDKKFYVFYEFLDFVFNYGTCKLGNLKAVDAEGNLYSNITEALEGS